MKTAPRRVGRPRTRKEGTGEYVGFRAPRELKERLEEAAAASGRSLSTEAQLRLEKSFDKQDLLGDALELAYGPRLAGILLLVGEMMSSIGWQAGFTSGDRSPETARNWIDDPFAYAQATLAALNVLTALRPEGDANILKNGEDAREVISPALSASEVLAAIKDPKGADNHKESIPSYSMFAGGISRLRSETEKQARRLLGSLIERIPFSVPEPLKTGSEHA